MKTLIIRLEPQDDVTSAGDKMGWGQAGRIVLIWPEKGHVLDRTLDLVLLRRRSESLGAQLVLVASDGGVRFRARQLGLPVHRSLQEAQRSKWRLPHRVRKAALRANRRKPVIPPGKAGEEGSPTPFPSQPKRSNPLPNWARLAAFLSGVLAVLGLVIAILPSAQLTLLPETRAEEITLAVQADPQADRVNLSGILPAREQKILREGRDRLTPTGSILFPLQHATGRVTFTNLTDQPVQVSAGTVVRTLAGQPARFSVTSSGSVPAGPGATANLPVRALLPGSAGNQAAGEIRAIEGELGGLLTVANPASTSGGADTKALAPSAGDRQRLEDQLLASLRKSALEELGSRLAQGDVIIPGSLQVSQVLEEAFSPAGEAPADQLSLSLRVEFTVQVVNGNDLRALAAAALDANLPPGYQPDPASLRVENLSAPAVNASGLASWEIRARRQAAAWLDSSQAIALALGQSPGSAQQRIWFALDLAEKPQVRVSPAGWPRLPLIPLRIAVQVVGEAP